MVEISTSEKQKYDRIMSTSPDAVTFNDIKFVENDGKLIVQGDGWKYTYPDYFKYIVGNLPIEDVLDKRYNVQLTVDIAKGLVPKPTSPIWDVSTSTPEVVKQNEILYTSNDLPVQQQTVVDTIPINPELQAYFQANPSEAKEMMDALIKYQESGLNTLNQVPILSKDRSGEVRFDEIDGYMDYTYRMNSIPYNILKSKSFDDIYKELRNVPSFKQGYDYINPVAKEYWNNLNVSKLPDLTNIQFGQIEYDNVKQAIERYNEQMKEVDYIIGSNYSQSYWQNKLDNYYKDINTQVNKINLYTDIQALKYQPNFKSAVNDAKTQGLISDTSAKAMINEYKYITPEQQQKEDRIEQLSELADGKEFSVSEKDGYNLVDTQKDDYIEIPSTNTLYQLNQEDLDFIKTNANDLIVEETNNGLNVKYSPEYIAEQEKIAREEYEKQQASIRKQQEIEQAEQANQQEQPDNRIGAYDVNDVEEKFTDAGSALHLIDSVGNNDGNNNVPVNYSDITVNPSGIISADVIKKYYKLDEYQKNNLNAVSNLSLLHLDQTEYKGDAKLLSGGFLGLFGLTRVPTELYDSNLTNEQNKEVIYNSIRRAYGYDYDPNTIKQSEFINTVPYKIGSSIINLPMGAVASGIQGVVDVEEGNNTGTMNKMFMGTVDTTNWGAWKYPAKFGEGVATAYVFGKVFGAGESVAGYVGSKIGKEPVKQAVQTVFQKTGDVLLANYVGELVKEGYIGIKNIKTPEGKEQLALTALEGAGFWYEDKVLEALRKIGGLYNPKVNLVTHFPIEDRSVTIDKIKEGISKPEVVTGYPVNKPEIFDRIVTDTRGSSKNVDVSFATPKTGELSYTGTAFTMNPTRDPTYWQKWTDNVLSKGNPIETFNKYGLPKIADPTMIQNKGIFMPKKSGETASNYFKRMQDTADKLGKVIITEAPKTVAKYPQPEMEVTQVFPKNYIKDKTFIGFDKFGNKIYQETGFVKDLSNNKLINPIQTKFEKLKNTGERVKTTISGIIDNYKWSIDTKNKIAKELAIDMKYKYNDLYVKNNDRYQYSGKEHVNNVESLYRKQLDANNLKLSDNEIKATAQLHDILKKKSLNFKDEPMIERAIIKGYLDDIPIVKKLTPIEKARMAKIIGLHQDIKPNILTNNLLDNYTKAFINADRLDIVRYGTAVNPKMLFDIQSKLKTKEINQKLIDNYIDKFNKMSKQQQDELKKYFNIQKVEYDAYEKAYEYYNPKRINNLSGNYKYNNEVNTNKIYENMNGIENKYEYKSKSVKPYGKEYVKSEVNTQGIYNKNEDYISNTYINKLDKYEGINPIKTKQYEIKNEDYPKKYTDEYKYSNQEDYNQKYDDYKDVINKYPDNTYPDKSYPDKGYPDKGYPDKNYPDKGYPEPGYPDKTYPEVPYVPNEYPEKDYKPYVPPDPPPKDYPPDDPPDNLGDKKKTAYTPIFLEDGKQVGFQPVFITHNNKEIIGDYFSSEQGAIDEGMIETDWISPYKFRINRHPLSPWQIKQPRKTNLQYKYYMNNGVFFEKPKYRRDKNSEKNFEWMKLIK